MNSWLKPLHSKLVRLRPKDIARGWASHDACVVVFALRRMASSAIQHTGTAIGHKKEKTQAKSFGALPQKKMKIGRKNFTHCMAKCSFA